MLPRSRDERVAEQRPHLAAAPRLRHDLLDGKSANSAALRLVGHVQTPNSGAELLDLIAISQLAMTNPTTASSSRITRGHADGFT